MNGWFTSGAFWAGFVWGVSIGCLALWYSLVRPMAKLLGFDKRRSTREPLPTVEDVQAIYRDARNQGEAP